MQFLYIIVNLSLFAGLALSHEHSHTYETTMDEDAPKPMRILEFTIRNLATEEMVRNILWIKREIGSTTQH